MSNKGKSTAQKKLEAVEKLRAWVREKIETGTLGQYIRYGRLNRTEIAAELGIARSTLSSTNDLARAELEKIEAEFIQTGILKGRISDGEHKLEPGAFEFLLASKERELKALRERLAMKTAENEELKKKLSSSKNLLDDIIPSGRRVCL
ncbi:hypothetical protein [Sulfitobacter sp. BSw21498]|uniref:hypothetical protein n=1 Tax=Sulfitobacter sp. BSw21498 TaxID=664426 RepID=UPI0011104211|nr:hypothetical protein [Sulfitobacter sp. BSw21498]